MAAHSCKFKCGFVLQVALKSACGQFSYQLSGMVGRAFCRFKLQTSSTSTNEFKIFISSIYPETGWTPCSFSVCNASHSALYYRCKFRTSPLHVYNNSLSLEDNDPRDDNAVLCLLWSSFQVFLIFDENMIHVQGILKSKHKHN